MLRLFLVAAAVLASVRAAAQNATISNTQPRRDVDGKLMDAHDGSILRHSDGLYYYYAMGYGDCDQRKSSGCQGIWGIGDCGFTVNHTINIWSSPDLSSWTFVREALPASARPLGVYYRVKVVYNPSTSRFVMWINMVPRAKGESGRMLYTKATYVVATAAQPSDAFVVSAASAAGLRFGGGGDVALFVDPVDGAGYVAYDSFNNMHKVSIERLAPDYLSSLGSTTGGGSAGAGAGTGTGTGGNTTGNISPANMEAPVLFGPRRGWYYLLFGKCCCFCKQGSGSRVWAARHPLGPWQDSGSNINRVGDKASGATIVQAQENFVITAPAANKQSDDGGGGNDDVYIYTGDRWQSAADHLKSHDLQYWQPLAFDDSVSPPTIAPLSFVDNFTLALAGR